MNSPTPIAVFAFRRPDHLERTLRALAACPEAGASALTIYCDGPRHEDDAEPVQAVRALARRCTGFRSVNVAESEHNRGLAASILHGVDEQLSAAAQVIVVEDDLVVSPHFLQYMNDGLDCYAEDAAVASIHGYCYPTEQELPSSFFIKGADCWGWATWSRAWAHFERDGRRLLEDLRSRGLTYSFDFDGSHPYTAMLEDQIAGRNDSWAVRWYASCFLKDMLTLYPGRSLVENIGNDGSGTHSLASPQFAQHLPAAPVRVERVALAESAAARQAFTRFFRRTGRVSIAGRVKQSFTRLLTGRA